MGFGVSHRKIGQDMIVTGTVNDTDTRKEESTHELLEKFLNYLGNSPRTLFVIYREYKNLCFMSSTYC